MNDLVEITVSLIGTDKRASLISFDNKEDILKIIFYLITNIKETCSRLDRVNDFNIIIRKFIES